MRLSMMNLPLCLTTDTVPQVCSRNHSGLFFRLMFTTSNGMFFASRVRMVRWAYGQNLKEWQIKFVVVVVLMVVVLVVVLVLLLVMVVVLMVVVLMVVVVMVVVLVVGLKD